MHPKSLYEVRHEVFEVITTIFNVSLRPGEVPRNWRDAFVTTIFKTRKSGEPGNYRPSSLT